MSKAKEWFISDTHWGHQNIIEYCKRPFVSAYAMDEYMISRWNERVEDKDTVYHCGDVFMGCKAEYGHSVLSRLNGRKYLILGNHDTLEGERGAVLKSHFNKITLWLPLKKHQVVLSHIALYEDAFDTTDNWLNVHGHIHERNLPSFHYVNISVEQTDYCPVSMDWIKQRAINNTVDILSGQGAANRRIPLGTGNLSA